MSIFFRRMRFLNELEVTGGEDADRIQGDEEEDTTGNDYTLDDPDEEQEPEPTDDEPDLDTTGGTDYTGADEEPEDEEEPVEDEEEPANDYTLEDPDDDNEEEPVEDEPDLDTDNTDYTDTDNNEEEPTEEPVEDEPDSDSTGDSDYTDDNNADTEGDSTDVTDDTTDTTTDGGEDNILGLEKNVLSTLTPQEMHIKNTELKRQFIDIYNLINSSIVKCNSLPKNTQNLSIISFVIKKLTNLKEMVYDYITKTYFTKTYIDNSIMYQQYLITLNTISNILAEITIDNK